MLCTLIKKKKTTSCSRFPVFSAYCSLQKKKLKRIAPREIRTCLLYATSPASNTLHHSGRSCRIAAYIRHSISNNLISSVYSAKTTDNRLEIKLAYATTFELQGQKNTTIPHFILEKHETDFQNILNSLRYDMLTPF